MDIYTSRVGVDDKDALDITVKSGDKVFAPTWDMVMGYKNGKIDEDEYRESYVSMMRDSYIENTYRWLELLDRNRVVLQCYCSIGSFCHRYILAELLEECGGNYIGKL